MNFQSIIKSLALGAGATILIAGLALAQGGPGSGQGRGQGQGQGQGQGSPQGTFGKACRDEINKDLRGSDRREAMRKCVEEKRKAAGLPSREDQKKMREARRTEAKDARTSCRAELKDQRFTVDERRKAMQDCMEKKVPAIGKGRKCRAEAEEKKLTRGSQEFRSFMQGCIAR